MGSHRGKKKNSGKPEKEIGQILKRINPDLKRLLELVDEPGEAESVFVESVRSGSRHLRVAWRIVKSE